MFCKLYWTIKSCYDRSEKVTDDYDKISKLANIEKSERDADYS